VTGWLKDQYPFFATRLIPVFSSILPLILCLSHRAGSSAGLFLSQCVSTEQIQA